MFAPCVTIKAYFPTTESRDIFIFFIGHILKKTSYYCTVEEWGLDVEEVSEEAVEGGEGRVA
jgi:hypothetical protein